MKSQSRRGLRALAAAAGLAAALAAPAAAHAACALQAMTVPVTMEGLRPLIPGKIAGQPVQLLLDSGAFLNSVDAKFAVKAKLKPVPHAVTGSHFMEAGRTVTQGVGGQDVVAGVVIAPSFEFSGGKFSDVAFVTFSGLGDNAGILGQNFLRQADDEYDLKNGVMRFVRPQGCEATQLAYWATPQMTYSMLPIETGNHLNAHTGATVTINGVNLRAIFDTGASTSFITRHAATRAGVKIDDPGVRAAGYTQGIDGDIKTWVGRFASVKIGDEEIKNTQLTIGQSEATDFDVLIGADFFLAHHVYVANSQGKLYFTYNGGPVFNLKTADDAPTAEAKPAEAKPAAQ